MVSDTFKEDRFFTYNEWNKRGFRIIKGSKAVKFNEFRGALFGLHQVYSKRCLNSFGRDRNYSNNRSSYKEYDSGDYEILY